MDQESNSLKQFFSLSTSPFLLTFKIKKHIFVGISLLVSFLIFSVVVVDLAGFEPHLCFGFLSKTITKEGRNDDVCDYSNGRWVRRGRRDVDETSYGEECRFLDPGFRCLDNGRKDSGFRQWRWQPHGCDLPRYILTLLCNFAWTLRYLSRLKQTFRVYGYKQFIDPLEFNKIKIKICQLWFWIAFKGWNFKPLVKNLAPIMFKVFYFIC